MSRLNVFTLERFPRKRTAMSCLRTFSLVYLAGLAAWVPPAAAQVASMTDDEGKRVFVNDNGTVSYRPAVVREQPATFRTRSGESVSREQMMEMVRDAAERYRLDPALVQALITAESAWNPNAISSKGAQGLMQLMPGTAAELGVRDTFDPRQNIEGGVKHLRALLEKYDGDLDRALAAYNAGGGAVDRAGGVPNYRETRNYVQKIQDAYFQPGVNRQPRFWRARQAVYLATDERGKRVFTNE